ncbi:unnamed protein product [Euphydryas editha]|uniref:Reverse transcriptase domain-containing protein n=1 Tax=Euphydryas editha TaxID=104508 RepID=A0AAU9TH02_EUPED|nr:unnamed protein product [Euphydryas editha]
MDKYVLSVFYQNCRGLKTKLNTIYMNILSHNYDIIILTETWLNCNIFDNELIHARYSVFRCDRDREACGRRDGGGVLVAVRIGLGARSFIPVSRTYTCAPGPYIKSSSPLVDSLLVELQTQNYYCIISAAYIPPNMPPYIYKQHLDNLQAIFQYGTMDKFIIVGDYNLPNMEWQDTGKYLKPVFSNDYNSSCMYLYNFINSFTTYQLNIFKNHNNHILDLFITNISECESSIAPVPLVPPDGNHPPFYVLVPTTINFRSITSKPRIEYNFHKVNFEIISEALEEIDWDLTFHGKNTEHATSAFYEVIYNIIKNNVPTKIVKSSKYPIWFNSALIHIYKNKNKAWIKWKTYKNKSDYETFSLYRNRFKYISMSSYKHYMKVVEESISKNINYFWKYIYNKQNNISPSTFFYNGITVNNPDAITHLYSHHFKSVFGPCTVPCDFDIDNIPESNLNSDLNLKELYISETDIMTALRALDVSKGSGLDNLPPILLRSCATALCRPLHHLFNLSLREGIFPTIWKSARITPVFKGGDKSNIENYRPISILSALSKLFEKLVYNAIYPLMHNVIIPEQHGFVNRRSTNTNLLVYTTYLFKSMDENKQTDCVYTDFRKAFDRVDHKILLEKLAFNGIRGNLWRWFKSYVTNRTQKVAFNGYESEFVPITSGVPQGSIIGPLLFLLFINDIKDCFKFCNILLYADDLKIYHTIDNFNDHQKFQADLDTFSIYCTDNKLELSLNKCKHITFTKKKHISHFQYKLCNVQLESVKSVRDLGIVLDCKLHLDLHIKIISYQE